MIDRIRYIWQLLVLASLLALLGILLLSHFDVDLSPSIFLITLSSVTLINLLTFILLYMGIQKSNKEGVVFLLAGIGVKFLTYLLFIFIVWAFTKNLSKAFIVTFFALYLVFTFLTAAHLLKILKNK